MDQNLDIEKKSFPPFWGLVGITFKTDINHDFEDIPALWKKWEEVKHNCVELSQIEYSLFDTSTTIAVYHQYEGDYTKPYSITIGYPLTTSVIVEGPMADSSLSLIAFYPSTYALYHTNPLTPFPQSIVDLWRKIQSSSIPRAYSTDLEVYGPDFPSSGQVHLYISLK